MKFKELFKELNDLGYVLERSAGSHQIFSCPYATRNIVVSRDKRELDRFLVKKYLKQARTSIEEYQLLLKKPSHT